MTVKEFKEWVKDIPEKDNDLPVTVYCDTVGDYVEVVSISETGTSDGIIKIISLELENE